MIPAAATDAASYNTPCYCATRSLAAPVLGLALFGCLLASLQLYTAARCTFQVVVTHLSSRGSYRPPSSRCVCEVVTVQFRD